MEIQNIITGRRAENMARIASAFVDTAVNISKSEEDELEKAKHQDGDIHPNGKWVWVSSACGGKGDWRTLNGRIHKKSAGGNTHTTTSTAKQRIAEPKKGDAKKTIHLTPDNVGEYEKKLNAVLDKKGYFAHATKGGSIEIYKKGDRMAMKNLKAAVASSDHIDWGPNEKTLKPTLESVIKSVFTDSGNAPTAKERIDEPKKNAPKYAQMEIKDAKKALMGKVVTFKDYGFDGRGNSADMVGEITNVRKYGKNQTPIATITYPSGDTEDVRLSDIDNGKLSNSYNTPISVGTDATELNKIKKKIADNKRKEAKNGLTYNFDEESNETWYEGKMGSNRVRVLQEKVGDDSWWNVEVNGKLLKTDNGRAMSFKSAQEAADEAKATTTATAAKTDDAPKNVPHINLKSTAETIAYAKTLSDFTFSDEESGWGKDGKAFSLTNKNGLKMIVDFVNDSEYVYDFEDKDGNNLYHISSTAYNDRTDWKDLLNPKTWSSKRMSELKSTISKYETASKRAKMRYDHYNKASDYQKYLDNKSWAQSASRRLEKVKKIASLSKAESDIFEKAHKDGDIHPNGKWIWVSSANKGKGDWRTLNGRTHKNSTSSASVQTATKQDAKPVNNKSANNSGNASTAAKVATTTTATKFVPKQTFKNANDMANKMNMHLQNNIDIQPFVDILGKTVYDKGVGTKYRVIRAGNGHYGEWECSTSSYLQKDGSGDYLEFKDKPSQEKLDRCAKLLKEQLAKEGYDVNPKFTVLSRNPYYQHVDTFGVGISIKITKKEVQSSSKTEQGVKPKQVVKKSTKKAPVELTDSEKKESAKKLIDKITGAKIKSMLKTPSGNYYVIYKTYSGSYKGVEIKFDADGKASKNWSVDTANSLDEAKRYYETGKHNSKKDLTKNWEDDSTVADDKKKQEDNAKKSAEKQANASTKDKSVVKENTETTAKFVSEVLGGKYKGVTTHKLRSINGTMKMHEIEVDGVSCYFHDGVFERSYSSKGYQRKKGFTIEFDNKELSNIEFTLNSRGDGYKEYWSNVTVEKVGEMIKKRIESIQKAESDIFAKAYNELFGN